MLKPSRTYSKWRALTGLVLIYVAVVFNLNWVWGIIFLMWVIPDIIRGETHFIEPISKQENPFLFWAFAITWIWLSLFILLFPLWVRIHYS